MRLVDGRFEHDGKPFFPIGFNYWPCRTGVHCWKHFDIEHWREDFQAMRKHGFNTVRMFLLWEDAQPEEDRVDEACLRHLKQVCDAAHDAGLWIMPTLLQGWMSGTHFSPDWRKDRNHIRDASLVDAEERLARAVAQTLKGQPNLIAIDLANEIDVICRDVDDASVAAWTRRLASAIREENPNTLVTNGSAVAPMSAGSAWSYEAQQVDFLAMHGYPAFWQPVPVPRLGAVRATTVFGYMTAFAGAYGPVMRQEFGTAFGGDSERMGRFVCASSLASYLAGANGFLYWCWRDFQSTEFPYQKHPFEAGMGYVDANLERKTWGAGYDAVRDFLRDYGAYRPVAPDVAILVPRTFKGSGPHGDAALALAYESLLANGVTPRVTDRIDESAAVLVVPFCDLHVDDIEALRAYAEQGGRVIAAGISFRVCSQYWEALTGTRQADIRRTGKTLSATWGDLSFPVDMAHTWGAPLPVFEPVRDGVTRLAETEEGFGVAWAGACGKGRVAQFVPPLFTLQEEDLSPTLASLFGRLLDAVGYTPPLQISQPCAQAGVIENAAGERRILLINHHEDQKLLRVQGRDLEWSGTVDGKGFAVLDIE